MGERRTVCYIRKVMVTLLPRSESYAQLLSEGYKNNPNASRHFGILLYTKQPGADSRESVTWAASRFYVL